MLMRIPENLRPALMAIIDSAKDGRRVGIDWRSLEEAVDRGEMGDKEVADVKAAFAFVTGPVRAFAVRFFSDIGIFGAGDSAALTAGPVNVIDAGLLKGNTINLNPVVFPDCCRRLIRYAEAWGYGEIGLIANARRSQDPSVISRDLAFFEIPGTIEFLSLAATDSRADALFRNYCLEIAAGIYFKDMASLDARARMTLRNGIARPLLRDPDILNAYKAFFFMRRIDASRTIRVAGSDIGGDAGSVVNQSPEFGIEKYVEPDNSVRHRIRLQMTGLLQKPGSWGAGEVIENPSVPISRIIPAHSLADFNPNPQRRRAVLEQKVRELKGIVAETGLDREKVLEKFTGMDLPFFWVDGVVLYEVDNGEYIVGEGHHRFAALIKAAHDGIIPADWLDSIPVNSWPTKEYPPAFTRKVLGMGAILTWPELFPPSMGIGAMPQFAPLAPSVRL